MNEAPKRQDRVLVIDDSPETLSFLTDALENAGLMVLVATDGISALALLEQITPDIMFDSNLTSPNRTERTACTGGGAARAAASRPSKGMIWLEIKK